MNNRTRFLNTLRFLPVDHPPLTAGGEWATTRRRWESEGLPRGADLNDYFSLEPLPIRPVAVDTLLCPPFKERIIEGTGEFVVKINARGVKERNFKHGNSMPEHLEYPIKGPADLAWLRERLNPDVPDRVSTAWLDDARRMQDAGTVVFCNGGMYFGFLNEHMGTQPLLYAYFDSPDFIHAVNDLLCTCCERAFETVLPHFRLDTIGLHEDMGYKNGPLISPAMFREFMMPYYRRALRLPDAHRIDIRWMDSDGDIRQLIPLWLECGVNCFAPMEVAAGMDVVAIRKEYGRQALMIGGFDKRILAAGKPEIKRELERLRPVIEEGGYVPGGRPFHSARRAVGELQVFRGGAEGDVWDEVKRGEEDARMGGHGEEEEY